MVPKGTKILRALMLVVCSGLLHAHDLIVIIDALIDENFSDAPLLRSRRLDTEDDIASSRVIVKDIGAPALDDRGHLTGNSVKILLAQAYSEGKLKNPAFKYAHCLDVTDIKHGQKGTYTEQLFLIESDCVDSEERLFILKGITDNQEIDALIRGVTYEQFEPIIYPHAQDGYPQIVFPIAYFSYKDQHNRKHCLSLMNAAPGQRVLSLMQEFARNATQQRESMHRIITEAYFEIGAQMARFYKRYAASGARLIPMGIRHGDFHVGNIFYDPAKKQITLIDNNCIAKSIGKPESVWRDFVPHLVKINPKVSMNDYLQEEWFALSAPSFMAGFLSIYPAADHVAILDELQQHMNRYEKGENKKLRYKIGVVSQALHALGKSIRTCLHEGDVFRRVKSWVTRRPLMAADVQLNAKDEHGNTALCEAVAKEELVLWPLIAAGADLNVRDKDGNAPLHNAVQRNKLSALKILLQAGADINLRNKKGHTPLDIAISNHNKEMIKELRTRAKSL